jgi:hypothetical protein
MSEKLAAGREPGEALFARNGRPVQDFRRAWTKVTDGISGGSGKNGTVTMHDLRRCAIPGMHSKGMDAAKAGTHLTADFFNRYIVRSEEEEQETAAIIEA